MLQGNNITFTIVRNSQGADDEVGGATSVRTIVHTGVKGRLSNLKPLDELRMQGIDISKMYNAVIQPVTLDIREDDYVIPESGYHANKYFRVRGVQVDSITPNDPRAHLSLRLERSDYAKDLQ